MKNKYIVIKIGTNILTTGSGALNVDRMTNLVDQISKQQANSHYKFIIVSSGAITCGAQHVNILPDSIPTRQAAASVGQILLMDRYADCFENHGLKIGQILLSKQGLDQVDRRYNVVNTISTLINNGIVPIINENDSIATDEIDSEFGDNDELSSLVAKLIQADKLILLTDIDGLFSGHPKKDKAAKLITHLNKIEEKHFDMVCDSISSRSRGGMKTKLIAAQLAATAGIEVIIGNGASSSIILDIFSGTFIGTVVTPY